MNFNTKYPAIEDLRLRAQRRIPKFAFEYLDGGCNSYVNIAKNTSDIRQIELVPKYLGDPKEICLSTDLFGLGYDAPFGMAPVGLQGLMWPGAPEILAKAAVKHNIPFVLSTVSTCSIEKIGKLTDGRFWFQLYHPAEDSLRDDLLRRAQEAGCQVLVLLCDVPTFGYRPHDIRNGLALPPKMSLRNIMQILARPRWAIETLRYGQPRFESLLPYMPKNLDLSALGQFMDKTFSGRLWEDRIRRIRDRWPGKIVLKGVASAYDAELAIKCGMDAIIVSNHGGRQLDAGQSSIGALRSSLVNYKDHIKLMMDGGIRSGPDIACCLAAGAEFVFMGKAFMYGVAALGKEGGDHTIEVLKTQLRQVMEQLGCEQTNQLSAFVKS